MSSLTSRLFSSLIITASLACIYGLPAEAATAKKATPPPPRLTYVKGYTPVMLGDYPYASLQVVIKDRPFTIVAPNIGAAISNVFVPVNAKNKDLVYVSTMNVGGKNTPTSAIYEYNLKNKKAKLLFSEKNIGRKLRIAGIDGNNLILVQASQSIEGGCSSLWNGQYRFFTLSVTKPAKTVKAYTVPSQLKKLGESEEQACKQSFQFKKS